MGRIVLIGCIVLLNAFNSFSQQDIVGRLKTKLDTELPDSAKCFTLDSLSMYYMFFTNKSDSAFKYANEFINYAFTLKNNSYLILAYAHMSFYYINITQYKEAMNMAVRGISLSEKYNNRDYLSALYYDLGWVYYNLNDNNEALRNCFKGISFLKENKDPFFDQALHLNGILGNLYQSIGKADSAIFYYDRVDRLAATSKELAAKDIAAYGWSTYYLYYKRDYQKADSVIAKGVIYCKQNGNFLLAFFYLFSSASHLAQGKLPEAIAIAKEALSLSFPLNDPAGANIAASLLTRCYEAANNRDSAYRYLKLRDSLQSQIQKYNNGNEIQQIRFEQELIQKEKAANEVLQDQKTKNKITIYVSLVALAFFFLLAGIQWRNNLQRRKANALLQQQKEKVEGALSELKSAQAQLIQSEKMASLGELTTGIAHEIQNPLNFVNNFSEVNKEMIDEATEEISKGNYDEVKTILNDIKDNSEKINHHGKRADSIVKGMLEHSRTSTGVKEPTDINKLTDEYLRLAYHGMRAKNKNFNAEINTDFDESIGKINIVAQDIGRVILNLINNAFYAINEKRKMSNEQFKPTITVSTKKANKVISISMKDNGGGIPESIKEKIFQPFFTTKPTGSGTGLGLSLSYDIVKAHGGEITVESKDGVGSEFTIRLTNA